MKISDILASKRTVSFEVFPPKPDDDADLKGIYSTIARLAFARPDFISVTYSPAGRNRGRALDIADFIQKAGVVPMSHFTSVGYTKEDVDAMLADLTRLGVENVMALRGDIPPGVSFPKSPWRDFRYASDLMAYLSATSSACLGAAAYPHGHQEDLDVDRGVEVMKAKAAAGAAFFITQLFFDNAAYFALVEKARAAGVAQPIIPGIMPVTRAKQIKRLREISGCAVTPALQALLDRYEKDDEGMEKAGIEYAAEQVLGLWECGAPGIHLYTMNRPAVSVSILKAVGLLSI
jgi:methylenetetrahydrofolate reductase (NADPH)